MTDKVPRTALALLLCLHLNWPLNTSVFEPVCTASYRNEPLTKIYLTVQNRILQSWRSKSISFTVCDLWCLRHLGCIFKLLLSHRLYPGKTSIGLCTETDVLILHFRFWALDNNLILFLYLLANLCTSRFYAGALCHWQRMVLLPSSDVAGSMCFGWVRKDKRNLRGSGRGLASLP